MTSTKVICAAPEPRGNIYLLEEWSHRLAPGDYGLAPPDGPI